VPSLLTRLSNQGGPPVPLTGTTYGAAGSVLSTMFGGTGHSQEQLMGAMGAVGTLFAIVDALSVGTAGQDWHLFRKAARPDGERTEVYSHAALDLWNAPNPFYTRQELVESGQQHQELVGETWLVVRWSGQAADGSGAGVPLELWCVRPDRMQPVPDPETYLAGYVYTGPSGEKVPLGRNEVIMLRRPNPLDPYRGMGAVQTVLADLDSIRFSAEWNRNFFVNSATPGGIILAPTTMDDTAFRKLRDRWAESHKGVARAHRVAVLEGGMTWVERSYSVKDMQFKDLREVNREVVREAFRFPKPMLGTVENVNRANADAAETVLSRWLLKQRLERWRQALNFDLLPMFATGKGYEFDFDNPTPEDDLTEAQAVNLNVQSAVALIAQGVDPASAFEACELPEMAMVAAQVDSGDGTPDPDKIAALMATLSTPVDKVISVEEARDVIRATGWQLSAPFTPPPPPPAPPMLPGPPNAPEPPANVHVEVLGVLDELAIINALRVAYGLPVRDKGSEPPRIPTADQPDLSGLQDDWQAGVDALLASWSKVNAGWADQLTEQVRRAISDSDLVQLGDLSVSQAAVTDGTNKIVDKMMAIATGAAHAVVGEAKAQGVTLDPMTPSHAEMERAAAVAARLLANGMAISAGSEALRIQGPTRSAADVAAGVADHLASLTDAQPRLTFGGLLTGAQNAARMTTMTAGPEGALYASEQLDRNTCEPCASINGRWLGNISDAAQVEDSYPMGAFGGYIGCLGGSRCRGTIFGVWRPEQTGGA